MKTPPFLMGAALLLLGWRSDLLAWALFPALLIEIPHFISARWEFSMTDLRRIFDLCVLLVLAEVLVLYSSVEHATLDHLSSAFSLKFSQWLPLPLFPIMLAQAFGTHEKIPLSVFSIFLRRSPETEMAKKSFNISYPYFGLCLMAAGTTPGLSPYFYPAVGFLIAWALWSVRPRRSRFSSAAVWLILLVIVSGVGFAGQFGLRAAEGNLEDVVSHWISLHWTRESDARQSLTSIGRVGRIRLSGKIVLRVTPETPDALPGLLDEANYNVYSNSVWRAGGGSPTSFVSDTHDSILLRSSKNSHHAITIAKYLRNGTGLLPLPKGASELHDISANLDLNELGTATLEAGPSLLDCKVFYGTGETLYGVTNSTDLQIPEAESSVLTQIGTELKLDDPKRTDSQKIQAIVRFFKNFEYSLNVTPRAVDPSREKTAVGQFLTVTKTGHCEYFATATVLLLRHAGIPARYATGFSISEASHSGETVLVRERHAHAWVLLYRRESHRWEELDTTPADLSGIEKAQTSLWEGISDAWSNLFFEFSKWRNSKASFLKPLRWLLIPLIGFFVWRVVFNKRRKQKLKRSEPVPPPALPGMDSEFYQIEERLSGVGMNRMPCELFCDWTSRVALPNSELLNHIIELHRRLRFDPEGLSLAERKVLKLEVQRWLAAFICKEQ